MNIGKIESIQGNKIEILEIVLKNEDNHLELSWKVYFDNVVFVIIFHNVSKFKIGEISIPFEIYGFEIIDHSQDGWEKDFTYEICDFEDGRVKFFCESFEIDE